MTPQGLPCLPSTKKVGWGVVLGYWDPGLGESGAKGPEVLVPPPLLSSIQGPAGTRGGLLDEGRKELIWGFSCVE